MTAADETARILAELCCTVIGAGGAGERVILLAQAHELGVARAEVVCDRCRTRPMTLGAAITNHYALTEARHRAELQKSCELGDEPGAWSALNPGLHKPGDLRAADPSELALEAGHINPSGVW